MQNFCNNFLSFALFLSLVFHAVLAQNDTCPTGCDCRTALAAREVFCTHLNLTSLQQLTNLSKDVTLLDVSDNVLKDLNLTGFDVQNLTTLHARNNGFQSVPKPIIPSSVFTQLHLSENFITKIENDTFSEIPSLESIYLDDNLLTSIPFINAPSLNTIAIYRNNLTTLHLDDEFSKLQNFSEIIAQQNVEVTSIEADDFAALAKNDSTKGEFDLSLADCNISYLNASAFDPVMLRLRILDLSGNPIPINELVEAVGRDTPNLSNLLLDNLHYPLDTFQELDGVFAGNKSKVSLVTLANNSLENFSGAENFLDMPNLQALNLSGNNFDEFLSTPSNSTLGLKYLNMANNNLTEIPKDLDMIAPNLERLDFRNNEIASLDNASPLQLLDIMSLDVNKVKRINSTFCSNYPALTDIKLKNNSVAEIQLGAFSGCKNLKSLDLSNNFLIANALTSAFNGLDNLMWLSLPYNTLGELPNNVFDIPNLESIDLSHSAITSVSPLAFGSYTKPSIVYMDNNDIKVISEGLLKSVSGKLSTVNFSYNPYNCSCDLLYFRDWLNTSRSDQSNITVIDIDTPGAYVCDSPPSRRGVPVVSYTVERGECDHVAPTTHNPPPPPPAGGGLSAGAVVGIVLAVLVVVALVAIGVRLGLKTRAKRQYSEIIN